MPDDLAQLPELLQVEALLGPQGHGHGGTGQEPGGGGIEATRWSPPGILTAAVFSGRVVRSRRGWGVSRGPASTLCPDFLGPDQLGD